MTVKILMWTITCVCDR